MGRFRHIGEKVSQKKKGKKPKKPKQPKAAPEQPKAETEHPKPGPSDSSDAQANSGSHAIGSSSEPGFSKSNRRLAALRAAKALEKTGRQKQQGTMKKSEEPAETASSSWSSLLQMQPPLFSPLDSTFASLSLSPSKSTSSTLSSWKSSSSWQSLSQSSMASELSTVSSELSSESSNRRHLEQRVEKAEEYYAGVPPIYDAKGVHIATGLDICDCLHEPCPGCFLACLKCGSKKCGTECRVNRQFLVQSIYYRKTI